MKIKRDAQRQKAEKEQLEKASQEVSGESIPLITTINSGREISDIYLKHAGNESSEDEEGTENPFKDEEDDEEERKEAESFKNFLNRHKIQQNKHIVNQSTSNNT